MNQFLNSLSHERFTRTKFRKGFTLVHPEPQQQEESQLVETLPFGMHKQKPLSEVPSDYLRWLIRTAKLSPGLRGPIAAELTRRGIKTPPAPPAAPPVCRKHPDATPRYSWRADALGRRHIRAECGSCGRHLQYVPQVEPFLSLVAENTP